MYRVGSVIAVYIGSVGTLPRSLDYAENSDKALWLTLASIFLEVVLISIFVPARKLGIRNSKERNF